MKNRATSIDFLNNKAKKLNIAVIGDIMLDTYYYGIVKRISPEAPVPVNTVNSEYINIGGAGNVAENLAKIGVNVYLGAVGGQDDHAKKITTILDNLNIDYSGFFLSKERQTTTKLRVIGSNQQMLRLDFEKVFDLLPDEERNLIKWFSNLAKKGIDGIIVSDYAKGLCAKYFVQKIIQIANMNNIPVLVDPKGFNWDKYSNADYITPNVKELGEATGQEILNETDMVVLAAQQVMQKFGVKSILATRSEKGMTFIDLEEIFTTKATAREVYDVSGAGDTVAAIFLAAIAGGLSTREAAFLANEAAGLVVAKIGTYAITNADLLAHLIDLKQKEKGEYRPFTVSEIAKLSEVWKDKGDTIVFTNGCFDILHTGHVTYLEKAAAMGKRLIVGLNTDRSVKRIKGESRPIVQEIDRAKLLSSLSCVDAVVFFDEDTPEQLIEHIRPDILVKGGDYCAEEVVGRQFAGKVKIIEFVDGYSTTNMIEKIKNLVREGKI